MLQFHSKWCDRETNRCGTCYAYIALFHGALGELNALNACLAVIRFKQLRGFYFDESSFGHLLFVSEIQRSWATDSLRTIELVRVQYVPKALELGKLYVAEEFGAALH